MFYTLLSFSEIIIFSSLSFAIVFATAESKTEGSFSLMIFTAD